MQRLIPILLRHERRALKDALHRDEWRVLERLTIKPEHAAWLQQNARLSRRFLALIESWEKLDRQCSISRCPWDGEPCVKRLLLRDAAGRFGAIFITHRLTANTLVGLDQP